MLFDDQIKGLKDFEAPPPADMFASILNKIKSEENGLAGEVDPVIAPLKHHIVAPPEGLYQQIVSVLFKKEGKEVNFRKVISIAAAACAILLVGLWGLRDSNNNKLADVAAIASAPAPAILPILADSLLNGNTDGGHIAVAQNRSLPVKVKKVAPEQYDIIIDNQVFTVYNNDLFGSFTSFKNNDIPEFLRGENASESVVIRVDRSTSINLSQSMVHMLQDLYKTKSNGKLTGKARRAKRKFDKWKQADHMYFDKDVQKNPMDPVDLGEFLF